MPRKKKFKAVETKDTTIPFSPRHGVPRLQVSGKNDRINSALYTAIFLDEQGEVFRIDSSDDSSYRIQIRITAEDSQAEAGTTIRRKFDARIAVRATPTLTSTPEEESPEASQDRRDSPVDEPAGDPGAGCEIIF